MGAPEAPHKALVRGAVPSSPKLLIEDQARNGRVAEHLGREEGTGGSRGLPVEDARDGCVTWYLGCTS